MNLYKKTEGMLYNYNKTKSKIKSLEIDIFMIESEYQETKAISYNEKSSSTNAFNSSVENEIINKEKRVSQLEYLKKIKESEIQKIDICLSNLDNRERQIIEMRYFMKKSNKYIASELYLSEEHICRTKKEIILNMIDILFNIN